MATYSVAQNQFLATYSVAQNLHYLNTRAYFECEFGHALLAAKAIKRNLVTKKPVWFFVSEPFKNRTKRESGIWVSGIRTSGIRMVTVL